MGRGTFKVAPEVLERLLHLSDYRIVDAEFVQWDAECSNPHLTLTIEGDDVPDGAIDIEYTRHPEMVTVKLKASQ